MKTIGFSAAMLFSIGQAAQDFDLEKAVQKNLVWIRPPTWDSMPQDMESFFR